jgi:monooxygenase
VANALRKALPDKLAYGLTRWKNVTLGALFFNFARKRPDKLKARLLEEVRKELGSDYDVDTHFTPRYNPWDQRLCLVPDGDLFAVIRDGSASVVTATIDRFTESGLRLTTGEELVGDVIVTATGLNVQMLGGATVTVDGVEMAPGTSVLHKGVMLSDIPNLGMWFGYTNASWTLKADLTSQYMCRMLNEMDAKGTPVVTARYGDAEAAESMVDFSSGYLTRSLDLMPKQGARLPWRLHQNYFKDIRLLRHGKVDDAGLVFSRPVRAKVPVSTISTRSSRGQADDDH